MQLSTAESLRAACAYATPRQRRLIAVEIGKAEAVAMVEGAIKPLGFDFSADHIEPMSAAMADHIVSRTAELLALGFLLSDTLAYADEFHRARDEALGRFLEGLRAGLPVGGASMQ